jgi:hypothetical protein
VGDMTTGPMPPPLPPLAPIGICPPHSDEAAEACRDGGPGASDGCREVGVAVDAREGGPADDCREGGTSGGGRSDDMPAPPGPPACSDCGCGGGGGTRDMPRYSGISVRRKARRRAAISEAGQRGLQG